LKNIFKFHKNDFVVIFILKERFFNQSKDPSSIKARPLRMMKKCCRKLQKSLSEPTELNLNRDAFPIS
jgi:hypothetical protein